MPTPIQPGYEKTLVDFLVLKPRSTGDLSLHVGFLVVIDRIATHHNAGRVCYASFAGNGHKTGENVAFHADAEFAAQLLDKTGCEASIVPRPDQQADCIKVLHYMTELFKSAKDFAEVVVFRSGNLWHTASADVPPG